MAPGSARTRIFPHSDHFPLGESLYPSDDEVVDLTSQQSGDPTTVLPFGLRFATKPQAHTELDLTRVRYDEKRQLGVIDQNGRTIPLIYLDAPMTLEHTGEVGKPTYDEIHDYDRG